MRGRIEFDQEPDWKPLEKVVAPLECPDFMHMGKIGALQLYKHRHTRRYLNIDSETGDCFILVEDGYVRAPVAVVLAYVLAEDRAAAWS